MNTQFETLSEAEITSVSGGQEGELVVIGMPGSPFDPIPLPTEGEIGCHDDPSSVICPDPLP